MLIVVSQLSFLNSDRQSGSDLVVGSLCDGICVKFVMMLFRYCDMFVVMKYVFIMKLFMCVGMQWVIIVRLRLFISSLLSEYRLQFYIMNYDDMWLLIVQWLLIVNIRQLVVIVLKLSVYFVVIGRLWLFFVMVLQIYMSIGFSSMIQIGFSVWNCVVFYVNSVVLNSMKCGLMLCSVNSVNDVDICMQKMKNRIIWLISMSVVIRFVCFECFDFVIMYVKIVRIVNVVVYMFVIVSCLCCSMYSVISVSLMLLVVIVLRCFQWIGLLFGCELMCVSVWCISMKLRIVSSMLLQQIVNVVCQFQ